VSCFMSDGFHVLMFFLLIAAGEKYYLCNLQSDKAYNSI
jgi:hypothetical protein